MSGWRIEPAQAADGAAILALLAEAGLPTDDLGPALPEGFVVAREGDALLGCAAVQRCGDSGLLRSVAVAPALRTRGLGTALVAELERRAARDGLAVLYLLTTAAERYFERLGYAAADRAAVPGEVRATAQFSLLCPASSSLMSKAMSTRVFNVLFLCTGNSARSILAEAAMNHLTISQGRFKGYSAGSHPKGQVNPHALQLLQRSRLPTEGLRSKSWDEFAAPGAPPLDFVFTVCDQAAGEQCPYWPGQPMTAHWGMPDPAAVEGSEEQIRKAFADTFFVLRRRIELFASLPFDKLDRMALQQKLKDIGAQ